MRAEAHTIAETAIRSTYRLWAGLKQVARARATRLILGVVISGLALALSLSNISLTHIQVTFSQVNLWLLMLALASVALNTAGKTWRWQVLLGSEHAHIGFWQLLHALLIGQMLNTILPSRVGDVSRAYMVGAAGPGWAYTLGTVVIEKFIDLVCYALLFALLLLLMPIPWWVEQSAYSLLTMMGIAGLAAGIVIVGRHQLRRMAHWLVPWLPASLTTRVNRHFEAGVASMHTMRNATVSMRLIAWSALIWGTAILNNYLVLQALHIDVPYVSALLILIVLQAGVAISSVPGNVGVFQYLCILTLSVFAVEQSAALSYGILLHIIVLVPTTLLGAVLFMISRPGIANRSLAD